MSKVFCILFALVSTAGIALSQSYTSYRIGSEAGVTTSPEGGICLMGGASEDDNAMRWFLRRVDGGDVLVLRTSGADGYNSYLYSELGVAVNSVETIVCNNQEASYEPYLLQKIQEAEGIWFAGGDQWSYVSYWRDTPVGDAIRQAITDRNIVVGGTSAGMAIQGQCYFSAQNGTVTSAQALADPYDERITIDSAKILQNDILESTVTDTHFDNPDRKGRLVTFLARIVQDFGTPARAIACDEYTAICIDDSGIARAYGGHPEYDDLAYFIQSNCELPVQTPEDCSQGSPLTWDLGSRALKAYIINADSTGEKTFDLNTWQTGSGGVWEDWSVSDGSLSRQTGDAITCSLTASYNDLTHDGEITIYPNPTTGLVNIDCDQESLSTSHIFIVNTVGEEFAVPTAIVGNKIKLDMSHVKGGMYMLAVQGPYGIVVRGKVMKI